MQKKEGFKIAKPGNLSVLGVLILIIASLFAWMAKHAISEYSTASGQLARLLSNKAQIDYTSAQTGYTVCIIFIVIGILLIIGDCIWAYYQGRQQKLQKLQPQSEDVVGQLERLDQLLNKGAITQEEYRRLKAKLLGKS